MAGLNGNNDCFDCGAHKVLMVRQIPDGKGGVIAERVLRSRHVMAVDRAGNTAPIKTHNAAINRAQHDPYAMTVLQCKWDEGWVPLGECPQGTQHTRWLPVEMQGQVKCRVSADGNVIGKDHPCKCVVAIISARRAAQKVIEDNRAQDKTDQQRLIEATRQQTDMMVQAISKIAEAAPAKDSKK